jgi:hypothetical protein
MQRTTKPLTYVEVSGATVTPGSILTYTGGGSVIMNAVPTEMLLDPSGAITIDSMVTAYNSLVWGLYQSGMIITEPRVWFGAAGITGVQLSRVGAPVVVGVPVALSPQYAPYSGASGAYSYISMNDALAALNGVLGGISGAQFRYADGRVSLIVQDGTTIRFEEAVLAANSSPTSYGSTRRMLNRLFLRDISGYIGVDLSGPLLIQGEPIAAPTYGVFPEPAPASNIGFTDTTIDPFDVSWNASITRDAAYYIHVVGNGYNKLFLTHSPVLSIGTNQGISIGTTYNFTVITTTPYEVSTLSNPTANSPINNIIIFPTFTISARSYSYNYIDITWVPMHAQYSMVIQIDSDVPFIVGAEIGVAKSTLLTPGIHTVTAYLQNSSGDTGVRQTVSVEIVDIPAPIVVFGDSTRISILFDHTAPIIIANMKDIIVSATSTTSPTVNLIKYASDTNILVDGLDYATTYNISFSYRLSDDVTIGPPTVLSASTKNIFGPIADGLFNTGYTNIYESVVGKSGQSGQAYGYVIEQGSPWIGKQFNTILFPLIYGLGLLTTLQGSIDPSYFSVSVYDDTPNVGTLKSNSSMVEIVGPAYRYNDAYVITLDNTVTITANMYILFYSEPGITIASTYIFSSYPVPAPIKSIQLITGADGTETIYGETFGVLCDFALI